MQVATADRDGAVADIAMLRRQVWDWEGSLGLSRLSGRRGSEGRRQALAEDHARAMLMA